MEHLKVSKIIEVLLSRVHASEIWLFAHMDTKGLSAKSSLQLLCSGEFVLKTWMNGKRQMPCFKGISFSRHYRVRFQGQLFIKWIRSYFLSPPRLFSSQERHILFVKISQGYQKIFEGVNQRGGIKGFMLTLSRRTFQNMRKKGHDILIPEQFLRLSDIVYILKRCRDIWSRGAHGLRRHQALPKHLQVFLKEILYYRFAKSVYTLRLLDRMFQSIPIHQLFLWNEEHAFEKAIILKAKQRGIHSLLVQHGHYASQIYCSHQMLLCDNKAIWGREAAETFRHFGFPMERLKIIGAPSLDRAFEMRASAAAREKIIHSYRIPADKKLIAVIASPSMAYRDVVCQEVEDHDILQMKAVAKAFTKDVRYQVFVKTRGREDLQNNREALSKEEQSKIIFEYNIDLYDLLAACDIVISYYSTVCFEAMIHKKAVIVTDFVYRYDRLPCADAGAAWLVRDPKELAETVQTLLQDTRLRETQIAKADHYLKEVIDHCDGQASERVVAWLDELVHRKS